MLRNLLPKLSDHFPSLLRDNHSFFESNFKKDLSEHELHELYGFRSNHFAKHIKNRFLKHPIDVVSLLP